MNLLDQSGLKGSLDNAIKNIELVSDVDERKNIIDIKKRKTKKYFNKKNSYTNIIIISFLIFFIFCLGVLSNKGNVNSYYDYKFLSLTNTITIKDSLYIKSLSIKNNNLLIVAETSQQKDIYSYLPIIERIFTNIKLKVDRNISQIWINHKIENATNRSIYEIFNMIDEIDGLHIEKEIIGNRLIAICNMDDFNIIFNYFDKIKLLNFEFNLELINYISKNRYYNLTIDS
jgi:hypothetical protein